MLSGGNLPVCCFTRRILQACTPRSVSRASSPSPAPIAAALRAVGWGAAGAEVHCTRNRPRARRGRRGRGPRWSSGRAAGDEGAGQRAAGPRAATYPRVRAALPSRSRVSRTGAEANRSVATRSHKPQFPFFLKSWRAVPWEAPDTTLSLELSKKAAPCGPGRLGSCHGVRMHNPGA